MESYLEDLNYLQLKDSVVELSVVGKAIKPSVQSDKAFIIDEEGEYLARDGILEEIIDIDCSFDIMSPEFDRHGDENNENSCETPTATQRDEVINLLFATIWPDVVQSLGPFLQQVLDVAKEHPELLDQARQQREQRRQQGGGSEEAAKRAVGSNNNGGDFTYAFDDQQSDGGFSGCHGSDGGF
eukprot:gene24425-30769_t